MRIEDACGIFPLFGWLGWSVYKLDDERVLVVSHFLASRSRTGWSCQIVYIVVMSFIVPDSWPWDIMFTYSFSAVAWRYLYYIRHYLCDSAWPIAWPMHIILCGTRSILHERSLRQQSVAAFRQLGIARHWWPFFALSNAFVFNRNQQRPIVNSKGHN